MSPFPVCPSESTVTVSVFSTSISGLGANRITVGSSVSLPSVDIPLSLTSVIVSEVGLVAVAVTVFVIFPDSSSVTVIV